MSVARPLDRAEVGASASAEEVSHAVVVVAIVAVVAVVAAVVLVEAHRSIEGDFGEGS